MSWSINANGRGSNDERANCRNSTQRDNCDSFDRSYGYPGADKSSNANANSGTNTHAGTDSDANSGTNTHAGAYSHSNHDGLPTESAVSR